MDGLWDGQSRASGDCDGLSAPNCEIIRRCSTRGNNWKHCNNVRLLCVFRSISHRTVQSATRLDGPFRPHVRVEQNISRRPSGVLRAEETLTAAREKSQVPTAAHQRLQLLRYMYTRSYYCSRDYARYREIEKEEWTK